MTGPLAATTAVRRRRVPWVGVGLVALSAAAFGAIALFARIAYDSGADVLAVLALRFALAATVLLVLVRARGVRLPRGRALLVLAALGGVGYVGQSAAYFSALTMAPASLVALLLYLYPGFVTVLSVVTRRERWSRARLLALGLATAGAALVIGVGLGRGNGPTGGSVAGGAALAVTAAVVYAGYIMLSAGPSARSGTLASSAVIVSAAAVVLTAAAVATGARLPGTATGWVAVAAIALVSTVAAILAFFAGLARLGPTTAATISTLEPVVTVVLAAAVLGEAFTGVQVLGGALVLTAVLVLIRRAAVPASTPTPVVAGRTTGEQW